MNEFKNIAVLIDADNTQMNKMPDAMREISARGRISAKRAYGNWKKDQLNAWEETIKNLAIKAIQQYDYVKGKNATDMALVIDTMDLLYKGLYDCFVIVSSDSDYTPLAIRLRESGVNIIGIGRESTPQSFKNACDEFIYLENLSNDSEKEEKEEIKSDKNDFKPVHALLKKAYDAYRDADDFVNVGLAGSFIKRINPGFDTVSYGFKKLSDFIAAFPEKYELRKVNGAEYRCKISPCLDKDEIQHMHEAIGEAYLLYKSDDGFAHLGPVGSHLKGIADKTYENCGYKNLQSFLEAFPERYETRATGSLFTFKLKDIKNEEEKKASTEDDEAIAIIEEKCELLKGSDGFAKTVDVKNALIKDERFKALKVDNVTDFIKAHHDFFEIKLHGPAVLFRVLKSDERKILKKIHSIITDVYEEHKDFDGFVPMTIAGKYIKDFITDEDLKLVNYRKISEFIESFPEKYAVCPGNGARYKCI